MHFSTIIYHAFMHWWTDFFGCLSTQSLRPPWWPLRLQNRTLDNPLSLGEKKRMSHRAWSGEWGGRSSTAMFFLAMNCRIFRALWLVAFSRWSNHNLSCHKSMWEKCNGCRKLKATFINSQDIMWNNNTNRLSYFCP